MKKVKLILGLLITIISLNNTIAQECNSIIERNENGALGKSIKTYNILIGKEIGQIKFELFMQKIEIQISSNDNSITSSKAKLLFKLNNNDSIIVFASRYGDSYSSYEKSSFLYKNQFEIRLVDLKKIENNLITGVKLFEKQILTEVKEKDAIKIQNSAKCFHSCFNEKNDILMSYTLNPESNCSFFEYKIENFDNVLIKRLSYSSIGYLGEDKNHGNALVISPYSKDTLKNFDLFLNSSSYCLNTNSSVTFKLENGDMVKFINLVGTKCGKATKLNAQLSNESINRLKKSPIKIIRLEYIDGYFDIETISIPNYFIENLDCLDK